MKRAIISVIVVLTLLITGLAVLSSSSAHYMPPYGGPEYEFEPVPFTWERPINPAPLPSTWQGGDDDNITIQLPFTFRLYDWSSNVVYISTNGYIDFKDGPEYWRHTEYDNQWFGPLPYHYDEDYWGSGEYQVCVYWCDLYCIPLYGQTIFYDTYSDHVTISWVCDYYWYPTTNLQFQVMLFNNGTIQMNYLRLYPSTDPGYPEIPTIGINRGNNVWGVNYWYNGYGTPVYSGTSIAASVGIPADVRLEPQSLNLESMGNWVNVKVESFPDNPEYSASDVNPTSVSVAGQGVELKFGTINDNRFIGKADRLMVEDAIGSPGQEVEVIVMGALNDGTGFVGMAVIKAT